MHRTFGYALSHQAACDVIRAAAKRAISRLAEFKPVKTSSPVELKIEFTPEGQAKVRYTPGPGIEQLDSRAWLFRGKDLMEAWFKFWPNF